MIKKSCLVVAKHTFVSFNVCIIKRYTIMKHFKLLKNLAWVCAGALLAAGCGKGDDPGPNTPIANIAVYHVSPDAPKIQFKLDGNVMNPDSMAFGTYSYYLNAYAGTREISAYQREIKKATSSVILQEGSIYSAWLTGRWATPEFVLIQDKLFVPAANKSYIRFVNMSVDAPALDLVTNTGTAVVSNKTYKTASDFVEITGGQNYNFVFRENGSTADKLLLPSVNIANGRMYTIVARGIYNSTGTTALAGDVLVNY